MDANDEIADLTIAETEEQAKKGRTAKAATEEEKAKVRLDVLRYSWGRYIFQFSTDETLSETEKFKKAEDRFRKWLKKYKPGTWSILRSENYVDRMMKDHPGVSALGRDDDITQMLNDYHAEVRNALEATEAAQENNQRSLRELLSESL